MTIGIIGLGLIGGSYAKAIKKYTDHKVLGMDISSDIEKKALQEGSIDAILSEDLISECRIIIVSLYAQATIDWINKHRSYITSGTFVMDTCGIKRQVCAGVEEAAKQDGFLFIGAHPMAGRELSGYDASVADLFQGSSLILTVPEVPEIITELAKTLGFTMVKCTTAENHDRIIAFTSQLAHIVSGAYIKSPSALTHEGFSAGSFKDMTRVAYLNENMWTELFLDNKDNLSVEIENIINELQKYKDALDTEDSDLLKKLLKEGREMKEKSNAESTC